MSALACDEVEVLWGLYLDDLESQLDRVEEAIAGLVPFPGEFPTLVPVAPCPTVWADRLLRYAARAAGVEGAVRHRRDGTATRLRTLAMRPERRGGGAVDVRT
jgi:hypothetical protein